MHACRLLLKKLARGLVVAVSSLCTRQKLSSRKLEERGVIRVVPNKVLGPCESGVVEEDIDGVHGMRGAMPWVASRWGCLKPTWVAGNEGCCCQSQWQREFEYSGRTGSRADD